MGIFADCPDTEEIQNFKFYFGITGIKGSRLSNTSFHIEPPSVLELLIPTPRAEPRVNCAIRSTLVNVSDNALIVTEDSQGNFIAEQTISAEGQWNFMVTLSYANRRGSKTIVIHASKGNINRLKNISE